MLVEVVGEHMDPDEMRTASFREIGSALANILPFWGVVQEDYDALPIRRRVIHRQPVYQRSQF
jgi:hypothetical protein